VKINVINNIPNVKVACDKNDDGSCTITLTEDKRFPLGEVKHGSVVKIGNREYIVLGHAEETTAVITKDFTKEMEFGQSGDYLTSDVRKYCNGEFYNELVAVVGAENIVKHTVKLVADDGTGKGKACCDNVSIITTENYRRYREFLRAYGSCWWTATRVTYDDENYARYVYRVYSDGVLSWDGSSYNGGVRPFCILNSSVLVDR
jgi:hypothetical protein